ncbi:SMP-30/gluconolactonase/LRE family protein [Microlunatus elymi]|nr:SMP-30/gluconolactonase/LRE family protein [Microlunatus elymi]
MITEPRLAHPEGVAIDRDGNVWCGGETGQIYRIAPDGCRRELVASTGGFCLGLAFGPSGDLFVCDLAHAAVYRLDPRSGSVMPFASGVPGHTLRIPNYPAFDAAGRLYVSDSWAMRQPGPGILRFDPDGDGELWHAGPFDFANGLALSADGSWIYVAETFGQRVSAIEIRPDGSAGGRRVLAELPGDYPDGLAVAADGSVFVGCYQPSRILRIDPSGTVTVVAEDVSAHILAHPTNIAFAKESLIAANHGRWHLTEIDVGVRGVPLPPT